MRYRVRFGCAVAVLAAAAAITVGVSALAASAAAYRLIRTDTALILRGEN